MSLLSPARAKLHSAHIIDRVAPDILTLSRRGKNGATFGVIDNLAYTYTSAGAMRLNSISETGALTLGYKANAASSTWAYDNNGNVTARTNVSVTNIGYNHLNLPDYFTNSGGAEITNTYDASGRKWSGNAAGVVTHYFGEIEYENNNLQAVYHEDGRIVPLSGTTYEYHFYLKDHLGNVRTVVKGTATAPVLMQEYHYYPFGMAMDGNWVTPTGLDQKYRYNGKELVDDLGLNWYDYGARWYDPAVGRWGSVDPMAEKMPAWSAYNYVAGNPLKLIDPDGMQTMENLINHATSATPTPGNAISGWSVMNERAGRAEDRRGATDALMGTVMERINSTLPTVTITGKKTDGVPDAVEEYWEGNCRLFRTEIGWYFDEYKDGTNRKSLKYRIGFDADGEAQLIYHQNMRAQNLYGVADAFGEGAFAIAGMIVTGPLEGLLTKLVLARVAAAYRGVTVIGETMARVEATAAKIPNARTLSDMPIFTGKPWQITSQMMQYNRQWILNELRSGRTILDIGADLSRTNPSIFYQMEKNMIKNFAKVHR